MLSLVEPRHVSSPARLGSFADTHGLAASVDPEIGSALVTEPDSTVRWHTVGRWMLYGIVVEVHQHRIRSAAKLRRDARLRCAV